MVSTKDIKQHNYFDNNEKCFLNFWRLVWHWRLEWWCWKFSFASQE